MKIVREHINEKFTEESDPIEDMGIGVIYQIKKWLDEMGIYNYYIRKDNTINVRSTVNIYSNGKGLKKLPDFIQFNIIYGNFDVPITIESCKGWPKHIRKDLCAWDHSLKSLKYFPKKIDGDCYLKKVSKYKLKEICKIGGEINN
jgi:hypothetical protein